MRLPQLLDFLTLLGVLVHTPAWAISDREYNEMLERCQKSNDLNACMELVPVSANDGGIEQIIGKKYYFGWGTPKDYGKAASWFQKSADKNNMWANVYLGLMYLDGNGLTRNYSEAQQLLSTVSSQPADTRKNIEAAMALRGLGLIFEKGLGVRPDQLRALDYFFKAVTLNDDSENVRNLFRCYTNLPEAEQEKLSKAQIDSVIAVFKKAGGIYQPALKAMPTELLKKNPSELILASNMPKPNNQVAFPTCAGVAAKHLYLQYQCRMHHLDCQQLRPDEVPSSLAVAGYGLSEDSLRITGTPYIVPYDFGADARRALQNLRESSKIESESCMSIEEIWATKFDGSTGKMRRAFDSLKAKYSEKHAQTESEIDFDHWLRELSDVYGIVTNESVLRAAVKKEPYETFLYDIMLRGCKKTGARINILENFNYVKIGRWPADTEDSEEQYSYKGFIATLKKQLKLNKPVITSFCIYQKYSKKEKCEGHSFVVYGYRRDCSTKGKDCKEYLKTMNSWGADYEKYFSDGWIDADHYYKYLSQDHRTLWLE